MVRRRKVAKKKNQAKIGIVKYFLQQPDPQNVSFKYSAMPNSPQSTKDEAQRIQDSIGIGHCTIGVALKEMGTNFKVTLGDLIKKAGPEGAADTEAIF